MWAVNHSDPVYRWPNPKTDWAHRADVDRSGARLEEAYCPTGNQRVENCSRRMALGLPISTGGPHGR